jgi:hypothetical protein
VDVDAMSYDELLALGERVGKVAIGLTQMDLDAGALQVTVFDAAAEASAVAARAGAGESNDAAAEDCLCAVCREGYTDGERLRTLLCGHRYHAECIDTWLLQTPTCPFCKRWQRPQDQAPQNDQIDLTHE